MVQKLKLKLLRYYRHDGSTVTLIDENLSKQLGLVGEKSKLAMKRITSEITVVIAGSTTKDFV